MNVSIHRITELKLDWNYIPSSSIPVLTVTAKTNDPATIEVTLFCIDYTVIAQFLLAATALDIPPPQA